MKQQIKRDRVLSKRIGDLGVTLADTGRGFHVAGHVWDGPVLTERFYPDIESAEAIYNALVWEAEMGIAWTD